MMDKIILNKVNKSRIRYFGISSLNDYFFKKHIKPVNGFTYDGHFRKMLISLLGELEVLKTENRMGSVKKTKFESALTTLYEARCEHAHNSLIGIGITPHFYPPNWVRSHINNVIDGLEFFRKNI